MGHKLPMVRAGIAGSQVLNHGPLGNYPREVQNPVVSASRPPHKSESLSRQISGLETH
jgi:hypothetical protein